MLNQITDNIREDFINKLNILNSINTIDLSKYTTLKPCDNKNEIDFSSFYMNFDFKFAGKYYEIKERSITIWIGYYAKYGFCISFWTSDQTFVESIIEQLRNNKIDCFCKYSGVSWHGKEEKYWIIVELQKTDIKEELQDEIKSILDMIL